MGNQELITVLLPSGRAGGFRMNLSPGFSFLSLDPFYLSSGREGVLAARGLARVYRGAAWVKPLSFLIQPRF